MNHWVLCTFSPEFPIMMESGGVILLSGTCYGKGGHLQVFASSQVLYNNP